MNSGSSYSSHTLRIAFSSDSVYSVPYSVACEM